MISLNAFLSFWGLFQASEDLFDDMTYPTEFSEDDKETFIENLLIELAELEVLYPDPVFMKHAIGVWSKKEAPVWDKLFTTTQLEYNPIWNKDGTITETRNLAGTDYLSGQDENELGSKTTTTGSATSANSDTLHVTGETVEEGDGSDFVKYGRKSDTTDTGTITRTEQGNIGITSTQQLINEEREVVKFNIMNYMITEFKCRFCILVY